MPGFTFTNYSPIKGQPVRKNLEALSKSLATIDEKDIKARETASAIQQSLAQIQLNAAEDKWKNNYIQNIEDEIGKHVKGGDYSGALGVAKSLAGKALSDGGLLGRIRANADYETALKTVNARNDISQVTKDRWKEENPYTYSDIKDSKGNVVAGTKWESNWNPVSRVDTMHYLGMLKNFVSPDKGQGDSAMFVDENGNLTSDPGKNFYGMAVKTTTGYERLSEAKLKQTWEAMLKSNPQIKASILQDYDDAKWLLGKSKDKDGKAFLESSITDNQGNVLTPEQYLASIVNPTIKNMAYNHVSVSHEYGNGLAAYRQTKAAEAAKLAEMGNGAVDLPTYAGMTVQDNGKDDFQDAVNNVGNAISTIEKYMPGLTGSKHNSWNKFKDRYDYAGMRGVALKFMHNVGNGKYVNYLNSLKPEQKYIVKKALNDLVEYGGTVNGFLNKAGGDKDAIMTHMAINGNNLLPLNSNTGKLIAAKNKITQNGKYKQLSVTFADLDEFNGALEKAQLTPEELKASNAILKNNDGKLTLTFDANNVNFYKLAKGITAQDQSTRWSDFIPSPIRTVANALGANFTTARTIVKGIDDRGNETILKGDFGNKGIVRSLNHFSNAISSIVSPFNFASTASYGISDRDSRYEGASVFKEIADTMNDNQKASDKFFESPLLVNNTEVVTSSFYSPNDAQNFERLRTGVIDQKTYDELHKKEEDQFYDSFITAELPKAKKVYLQTGDEAAYGRELSDAEKQQYRNLIADARINGTLSVRIANKDGKLGYYVTVPRKTNSKGEPIGESVRMFVLANNWSYGAAQDLYEKDTKTKSLVKLGQLARYNTAYISPTGAIVSNVDSRNNVAKINNQVASRDDALRVINEGYIIEGLIEKAAMGDPNLPRYIQLAATEMAPGADAATLQNVMSNLVQIINQELQ